MAVQGPDADAGGSPWWYEDTEERQTMHEGMVEWLFDENLMPILGFRHGVLTTERNTWFVRRCVEV